MREEAKRLLDEEVLGYTVATGVPGLREAVAAHHRRTSGIDVTLDDVVITTGSSGGFLLAFLAAFEPGDRVVMARPGYACYRNVLTALGCEVVEIDCGPETRFQPTVEQLARARGTGPRPRARVARPTPPAPWSRPRSWRRSPAGARRTWSAWSATRSTTASPTASAEARRAGLADLAHRRRLRLVQQVLLDDRLAPRLDARAGGPAAPGRRADRQLHHLPAGPQPVRRHRRVHPESYAELDGHVARYAINRSLLLDGLPALGIDRLAPADGAFYVYADIGHLTDDSYAWCLRLLDDTGVATAPGIDFDTRRGNEFVRLSFAGSAEEITEGLDRLGSWLLTARPVSGDRAVRAPVSTSTRWSTNRSWDIR